MNESNKYAVQSGSNLELTKKEFLAFLGILIFMGFHPLPCMKLYWSLDENFHVERIARIMPLKRFLKILRYVHLNDNEKMPTRDSPLFDKLYKVRPFIQHIQQKYLPTIIFTFSKSSC